MIKSKPVQTLTIDIDNIRINISKIGKHGSATFYQWTHIEPSEGIHPTVDAMPLTKEEILTRIDLLSETYNFEQWIDVEYQLKFL